MVVAAALAAQPASAAGLRPRSHSGLCLEAAAAVVVGAVVAPVFAAAKVVELEWVAAVAVAKAIVAVDLWYR